MSRGALEGEGKVTKNAAHYRHPLYIPPQKMYRDATLPQNLLEGVYTSKNVAYFELLFK